jgi:chorismate dehydratase
MKAIKLSAVAYHNTRPFLYGLQRSPLASRLDIQLDIPAEGARKLRAGELSLALVPVGVLDSVPEARIISPYAIGCDGPVRTVCLYSERPLAELDRIWLDYHSVTSVRLLDLLLREHWHHRAELVQAVPGYREQIAGRTGGLVIGDRAMGLEQRFAHVLDLGEAWKQWTGLPFVFAVWVSTTELDGELLQEFNAALAEGLEHLEEVAQGAQPEVPPGFDLLDYYRRAIRYPLDAPARQGLQRFLEAIGHRAPRYAHTAEWSGLSAAT